MQTRQRRGAPLAAVLAGGAGTRLGGAKALIDLGGRPLVAYPLDAIEAAGLEAVIVAKAEASLPDLGLPVLIEAPEPRHPLLGVVTALREARARPVLSCPCDMPFVTPELIERLAAAPGTTTVQSGGRLHPLLARYEQESLPALERALEQGLSATAAVEGLSAAILEATERETFNVNTPEDLDYAASIVTRAL